MANNIEFTTPLPHPLAPSQRQEVHDDKETVFLNAVERSDVAEVKRLLSLSYNPEAVATRALEIALSRVITCKNYDMIALLASCGDSCTLPLQLTTSYLNIFDYAFRQKNYGLLFALRHKYSPHIPLEYRVLHTFFETSELEDLEFTIKHLPNLEFQAVCDSIWFGMDEKLRTKYHHLFSQNCDHYLPHPALLLITPELTKKFLDRGVSCDARDSKGLTAVHYLALDCGNSEVLPILLEAGVDLSLTNNNGETPFTIALENEDGANFQFLRTISNSELYKKLPISNTSKAFEVAICCGFLPEVELLSQNGVSNDDLELAAGCSTVEVVSFLVSLQLSKNAIDEETMKELVFKAQKGGNSQVGKWLVEHYVHQYPELLEEYVSFDSVSTTPLAISEEYLQEWVQKKKQSPNRSDSSLSCLFVAAVIKQERQIATFLFDHIDTPPYFRENFYKSLFKQFEERFIEKVLKKDLFAFLRNEGAVVLLKNLHAALFDQLASEVVKELFLVCKREFAPLNGLEAFVIHTGQLDLVKRFYNTFPGYKEEKALILAIQAGNEQIIHALVDTYSRQNKCIDFPFVYKLLCSEEALARTIGIQKNSYSQSECGELAKLLTEIIHLPHFFAFLIEEPTFSEAKRKCTLAIDFAKKLAQVCTFPFLHLSLRKTAAWLVEIVFVVYGKSKPKLVQSEAALDAIVELVARARSNEDYVSLLQALQTAPDKDELLSLPRSPITDPQYVATTRRPHLVETTDAEGRTALFHAAAQGNLSEVKKLLALGYNPNSRDAHGTTILEAALGRLTEPQIEYTMTGSVYAIAALLFPRGATCRHVRGTPYLNIFDFAFHRLNYGLLFSLRQYYRRSFNLSDEALKRIFYFCELSDLQFLTKHYPNLDLRQNKNQTICHAFLARNREDLLRHYSQLAPQNFTKCVQDQAGCNDEGLSLLAIAFEQKNMALADFLLASGHPIHNDPYLFVIHPEGTKKMLEAGARLNEQDRIEQTTLHYLARDLGDIRCLPILLEAGADLRDGLFDDAFEAETHEFCKIVFQSEQYKNLPRPPLHEAILAQDIERIEKALKNEDVEQLDSLGDTALEVAIRSDYLPAVKLVAQEIYSDDVIFAAIYGSVSVFSFLVHEKFPAADEDIIAKLFKYASEENKEWILREYAHLYPHVEPFGMHLLCKSFETNVMISQEYVQKILQSKDPEKFLREAVMARQFQTARLLLDSIQIKDFRQFLFACPEEEFVEEVIKKQGIPDSCFTDGSLSVLQERYPTLFNRLSCELFDRGFSLCQKEPALYVPLLLFAVASGSLDQVKRFDAEFESVFPRNNLLCLAIKAKKQDIVAYLCEQIPNMTPLPGVFEFAQAIRSNDKSIIRTVRQAYSQHQIYVSFKDLYLCLQTKEFLIALQIQRVDFFQHEYEAIATLLSTSDAITSQLLCEYIDKEYTFSELKRLHALMTHCAEKLPSICKVPCGSLPPNKTIIWLLEQIFSHVMSMNPKLFASDAALDTILHLVEQVDTARDYESLFVALQVAPDLRTASLAFQAARRKDTKITKEQFLLSSREERKEWLAYALVYRDRSFIPLCYHILKHHISHSDLLLYALDAIHQIGVKRYNDEMENSLAIFLQEILQIYDDEQIKIAALQAYVSVSTQPLLDFLITQLEEARKMQLEGYEAKVAHLLGTSYEWTSDQETMRAVEQLLTGLQSPCATIRFQTALALSAIPNEKGLLAALEVVRGATWDPLLRSFGKNRRNILGPYWLFRCRPDAIHDNRDAVMERILFQLIHLHEKKGMLGTIHDDRPIPTVIDHLFQPRTYSATRYIGIPIAYPQQADLIRGVSTRKGCGGFRESVRDLLRKGAGSSQLTDYDTAVYSGTWNKIGHAYASHNKDLFFGNPQGSIYFSPNKNGVVSESALVVFPAAYYTKEYLAGHARLEKEWTLNNVLYRGIPHRWIKALYLPIRYKADIELLAGSSELKTLVFTSDLFTGDSIQELKAFRRLLTAPEVDLAHNSEKAVPFVEKIHYFPEETVEKIGKRLEKDGVHFVTEEELKQETVSLNRKPSLISKHYKNPWLFAPQDRFLQLADDAAFRANIDLFLRMLPSTISASKQLLCTLETDSIKPLRVYLRAAALLREIVNPAEILAQNPHVYGLTFNDIPLVTALLKHRASDKETRMKAFSALTRRDISFEVFSRMLDQLCNH